jgi:hypothetical protein
MKALGECIYKVPVKVEDHPDYNIPAAIQFLTLSRVNFPGSRTIETSGVDVHKLGQDTQQGQQSGILATGNLSSPLLQDILAHGVVILQFIAKVFNLVNLWEWVSIQLNWEQIMPNSGGVPQVPQTFLISAREAVFL